MTEAKKQLSEEKTASASYVLSFFSNIMQLNHYYANYENLLIELQTKYGGETDKETPEDKEQIRNYCQTLRYYSTQAYVGYCSIMEGMGKKYNEELKEIYEAIKSNYIIKRGDIEAYVIKLNSVIMNTVIKDLLQSSQDLLNQIYSPTE